MTTKRQEQILRLMADGLTIREAAARLGIQTSTAKNHLTAAYRELGVRNSAGAFAAMGWLSVDTIRKETDPRWDQIPTDEEILLARSVLVRMSRAISVEEQFLWGGLVEARRILTVSIHYLSGFPGHTRHYQRLWNQMLDQDR